MEYHEAKQIIKDKLEKMGIEIVDDSWGLKGKNFQLDIKGKGSYRVLEKSYNTVSITVSTGYYYRQDYKKVNKYVRNLDVIKDDYINLVNKIKEIIKIDKSMAIKVLEISNNKILNFKEILNKFKNYSPKEVDTDCCSFIIPIDKNLQAEIYTEHDEPINILFTGNYEDLIVLLNKLSKHI